MIFCSGSDIVAVRNEGQAETPDDLDHNRFILMHRGRPAGNRAPRPVCRPRRRSAATIGAFPAPAAYARRASCLLLPPATASARSAGAFTERQFRDALAQFATGVTVIAARRPDGRYAGFTANSFNSVSLDPPLVVWSLNRRAENLAAFENAERYAINVLAHDQIELARRSRDPMPIASTAFRSASAPPTRR